MGLKTFFLVILVILLGITSYYSYLLYTSTNYAPAKGVFIPKQQDNISVSDETSYSEGLQFYSNMRFNHAPITYKIAASCNNEKNKNMVQAFDFLEDSTEFLSFTQTSLNEDITIICDEQEKKPRPGEYYIAGEGGPTSAVKTGKFHVIEHGEILLFYKESNCDTFNVELHELLHVFGFAHSTNKKSIMYNITSCDQDITRDIINELNYLYSIAPFPDITFTNISVEKHGVYIDFSVRIVNQGLANLNDADIKVIVQGNEKESWELNKLGYGEGKILTVENLNIGLRTFGSVIFELQTPEQELDKNNNKAEVFLS